MTTFFSPKDLKDRSFFMTKENAELVRSMSETQFRKHAKKGLAALRLQLRVLSKAARAKAKADQKGVPLRFDSMRDGINTAEKCKAALAELEQRIKEL